MEKSRSKLATRLTVLCIFGVSFVFGTTQGYSAAFDYFPRSVGNTWTYTGLDEEGKEHQITKTIIEKEAVIGSQCFVMENKINGVMYEKLWFDDGEAVIKVYRRDKLQSAEENIIEKYIFYPPVLSFDTLPSSLGQQQSTDHAVEFTAIKDGKAMDTVYEEITSVITALGEESVVTPAGTFDNCIKSLRKITTQQGHEVIQYIWLAPGVGQVKFTLGDIEFKLSSYNLN